jgi:hypothetical protein
MLSAPINVRPSHTGVVSASKLQRYPAITPGVLHQPEPQRRTLHLVAPNLRDEGVIQKPLLSPLGQPFGAPAAYNSPVSSPPATGVSSASMLGASVSHVAQVRPQ